MSGISDIKDERGAFFTTDGKPESQYRGISQQAIVVDLLLCRDALEKYRKILDDADQGFRKTAL